MEQKTEVVTAGLEQKLKLRPDDNKTLEELRQKRQTINAVAYSNLDSEQRFADMSQQTAEGEKSKLNQGLDGYREFKQTIAELSAGVQDTLDEYVEFAAKSKNYQGKERFYSIIRFKGKANRTRIQRLKTMNPRENLNLVRSYTFQLIDEILQVRADAEKSWQGLQTQVDLLVEKIRTSQPKEEALKEKLDALDGQYKSDKQKYDTANPAEQAVLLAPLNVLHQELAQVRNEYQQVFTKYNQAQQTLAANEVTRNSFEEMVNDLTAQASQLKEKIENVSQIYEALPEAVKIMMTTKGMEGLDKTVNTATDRCVDITTKAAAAVKDATLARLEVQVIEDHQMMEYLQRIADALDDGRERFAKIRTDALRSQEERYKPKA